MTLIKKIQLAAEQNNFEVWVTGDKRKYKYWSVAAHSIGRGKPYKAITGDNRMFASLCSHLIQQRKGTEGYKFTWVSDISFKCEFIDGDFTYVISQVGGDHMILVYKNN